MNALSLLVLGALMSPGTATWAKDYTRRECPVIGNSRSMIYHTPASDSYRRLLQANRRGEDHRVCFRSEKEARAAGYRKSRK
ncbi:MAG TPA: hypothetical protein VNK67_06400 [Burkholderiales bacterium]|nr:hypothetical protein [Burkholderiales bacterium]